MGKTMNTIARMLDSNTDDELRSRFATAGQRAKRTISRVQRITERSRSSLTEALAKEPPPAVNDVTDHDGAPPAALLESQP